MRKSTLFLSAALTAFVMTMLAGLVYAYSGWAAANLFQTSQSSATAPAAQDVALVVSSATPAALNTPAPLATAVSPQDAAVIAAKFMNRTDLYSVELVSLGGIQVYKVTFVSGDVANVGLDGRMVSIAAAPPTVPAAPPPVSVAAASSSGGHSSGGGRSGGGGSEHEGGD